MAAPIITDLLVRAYFASVIGPSRAPFGRKASFAYPLGRVVNQQLALNSTRDRVLYVTVTRSDVAGAATIVTFSQSTGDAASVDFSTAFAGASIHRFTLFPDDSLSMQNDGTGAINVVVAQETW